MGANAASSSLQVTHGTEDSLLPIMDANATSTSQDLPQGGGYQQIPAAIGATLINIGRQILQQLTYRPDPGSWNWSVRNM